MTPTPSPITDVVGLCVFIAAMAFSPDVSAVVGPYAVIIAAAAIGASFALARRQRTTRAGAVWFFVRIVGLAVVLTVGLAQLVASRHPDLHERVLIAPIALLVGAIGDGWPALLQKVVSTIYAALDLVRGRGGSQ